MENQFQEPDFSQLEETPAAMNNDDSEEGLSQTEIQRVLQKNEASLLAIEGVVGVGIQRGTTGEDVIVVYVRDASVKERVPQEIDGYPVIAVVSGEFDAQSGPA